MGYWGVNAGYPAVCPSIPVPQIALQGRIVLNILQGTKGLTDGRLQDTAGHRVLHGTGTGYCRVHSTSGHRALQGKEYYRVQMATRY